MGRGPTSFKMETPSLDSIERASPTGLDSINGRMGAYTLESSRMDRRMEKANGRNCITPRIAMHTMESTSMTKRTGLVSSNGKVETFSKACIKMMKEMATVRCTG